MKGSVTKILPGQDGGAFMRGLTAQVKLFCWQMDLFNSLKFVAMMFGKIAGES